MAELGYYGLLSPFICCPLFSDDPDPVKMTYSIAYNSADDVNDAERLNDTE